MKISTVNNYYLPLMKLFTVNKNINGCWKLISLNDISLTCYKTTKSHLIVRAEIVHVKSAGSAIREKFPTLLLISFVVQWSSQKNWLKLIFSSVVFSLYSKLFFFIKLSRALGYHCSEPSLLSVRVSVFKNKIKLIVKPVLSTSLSCLLSSILSSLSSPQAFTYSILTVKALKEGLLLFKVNNKGSSTTSLRWFWFLYC